MLVYEAIERALGEDIPWAMKNDLSVLLMQQMDESGIVNSTEFAQRLQTLYGLASQKAEILADVAMAAVTSGMGKGKGSAMPVPTPTKAGNGLVYQSNGKHIPGQIEYNRNAGTEPTNSIQLFDNSVENEKRGMHWTKKITCINLRMQMMVLGIGQEVREMHPFH